jgi:hypothetical protein
MASTYLSRTASGGSRTTWTISTWVKRGSLGSSLSSNIFNGIIDTSNETQLLFTTDSIEFYDYSSASRTGTLFTNAKYRDTSAWYHIVAVWDTTNATAGDRMRLYVNGVEETSFATDTQPSLNQNSSLGNGTYTQQVGLYASNPNYYFNGSMSHFHFIDGTAYDASAFGEYDAQNVWKPKTQPSVTYGTNGFFLKFANSGSLGTDSSGNDNDFTVNGTGTQTLDTPSNVFCTMNPLDNYFANGTFANGNNTVTTDNGNYPYNTATIGASIGKWYWECKWSAQPTGSTDQVLFGIAKRICPSTTTWLGSAAYTYAYQGTGTVQNSNSTIATYTTMSIGDIIGVALDLDNNRLYFSKNGVWQGSSDPENGTNPISITAPDSTSGDSGFYFPAFGDGNTSLQETGQFNFGNGYYGTTAVSTPNADGDGYGKFEYSVPTGYYALCTKNIQTYG